MKIFSLALLAAIGLALVGCQQADSETVSVPDTTAVGGAPSPAAGAAAGGAAPMVGSESLQGGTGGGPAQAAIERARAVGSGPDKAAPSEPVEAQPYVAPADGASDH
ncbi:MAG: hypothetical protein ACK4P3_00635 [Fimbriimonadaceae bacterium]